MSEIKGQSSLFQILFVVFVAWGFGYRVLSSWDDIHAYYHSLYINVFSKARQGGKVLPLSLGVTTPPNSPVLVWHMSLLTQMLV